MAESASERRSATPSSWKPEGYNDVAPYLVVPQPQRIIDFLVAVFDAVPLRRHEAEGGRLAHAEVRVGDSVVMLGDAGDGTSVPCHVHVYVADVDAVFARAVAAGGQVVQAPVKKDDPDKRGGVTDPSGAVTWWIGTQLE